LSSDTFKRGPPENSNSQTIDPNDLKPSKDLKPNLVSFEISNSQQPYNNAEMMKLEKSIQKLKDSMRSTDSLRNSKILDQKTGTDKDQFESASSGKYWAKKVTTMNSKEKASRLNKLGDNNIIVDTKVRGKVVENSSHALFGISTYRNEKPSSFANDSGDDTLERADHPDVPTIKGLNSSRTQYDPSLVLDRGDIKQVSDKKKVLLFKDRPNGSKPLY